jgi:hypothetical protein
LKPPFFTVSKVDATTGALFQDPSSGTASRVFPRFQPGCRAETKLAAEIALNVPVHDDPVAVAVAVAVCAVVFVVVASVVAAVVVVAFVMVTPDAVVVPPVVVPGIH